MKVKKYRIANAEICWKKRDTVLCESDGISYGDVVSGEHDAGKAARALIGNLSSESVVVIMLDNQNRVSGAARIESGVSNQCQVYPKKVFAAAILSGATSIILAHNHPAGANYPSEADWRITNQIKDCGKLLELPLLDHIIITDTTTQSMRSLSRWNTNN
jgi:DNA repair protein RadC